MFFLCSSKQNVLRQVKPMGCVSRHTEMPGASPGEHRNTAAPGITRGDCAWEGVWEEEPRSPGGQGGMRTAQGTV